MTPDRREIVLIANAEDALVEFRFGGGKDYRAAADLICSFCMRNGRSAVFAVEGRASQLCIDCAKSCLHVSKGDELRRLAGLVIASEERAALEAREMRQSIWYGQTAMCGEWSQIISGVLRLRWMLPAESLSPGRLETSLAW